MGGMEGRHATKAEAPSLRSPIGRASMRETARQPFLPRIELERGWRENSPSLRGLAWSVNRVETPLSLPLFSSFCHSTLRLHLSRYDISPLSLSIRNSAQLHSATSPNERIDSMSFGFHLHSLIMSEHANDYPSVDAPDAVSCDVDGAFHHSRREREGERREE